MTTTTATAAGQNGIAYSYIRWSSDKQTKGDSLRRQTEATARFCERNGLQLQDVTFRDIGISAFKGANIETGMLGQFLHAVETGKIKTKGVRVFLVVESLDRISRGEIDDALDLFRRIVKSGVTICTLNPEYRFEPGKLDLTAYMMAIVSMARAHEESQIKSERIRAAWANKFRNAGQEGQKKLTRRCPGWLRCSEDKKSFIVLPGPAAIVKRIFKMAVDGYGVFTIVKTLNQEGVENFGRVKHWGISYVMKILRSRAVLGEFIPNKKNKYHGKAVPSYYPALVTEETFYKASAALASRERKPGPRGPRLANLFTGILFDASDGSSMILASKILADKRRIHRLVSAKAVHGVRGSVYCSVPYDAFEGSMLAYLNEIQPSDILPAKPDNSEAMERLSETETRLAKVTDKITTAKRAATSDAGNFDALLDILRDLESQRKQLTRQVEQLRSETHTAKDDNLSEVLSIGQLLRQAKPEELSDLRTRLRARIASLIGEIWVAISASQRLTRALRIQVHFKAGGVRRFRVFITQRHTYSVETKDFGVDLRQLRKQAATEKVA